MFFFIDFSIDIKDLFKFEKSIGTKRFVLINLLLTLKLLLKKTFRLFDKQSKTKKLNKFSKLPKEYFEAEIKFNAFFLVTKPL